MRILLAALLLVMLGCAGYQPEVSPVQPPPVREVPPPLLRYRITYQNRGVEVVPDFAGLDRNGEYVVAPVLSNSGGRRQ